MKRPFSKIVRYFSILPFGTACRLLVFYGLRKVLNPYSKVFYSQHGEDGLIQFLVGESDGFYIDVGCNRPIEISNTFRFYLQGWKGISIDANQRLIEDFRKVRKKDTVVCSAISDKEEELEFFEFECDTVSTVDKSLANERTGKWSLRDVRKVKARTLNAILEEVFAEERERPKISLVSIDIEGYSLQALKSFDLAKYRPRLIVIEIDDFDFGRSNENETVDYLKNHNYYLEAFDSKNGYFILAGQR